MKLKADDIKLWSITTIEDLHGLVGPKTTVAENNTKHKECARLPTISLTCTTLSRIPMKAAATCLINFSDPGDRLGCYAA